jgi:hypothetical protein
MVSNEEELTAAQEQLKNLQAQIDAGLVGQLMRGYRGARAELQLVLAKVQLTDLNDEILSYKSKPTPPIEIRDEEGVAHAPAAEDTKAAPAAQDQKATVTAPATTTTTKKVTP